MIKFRTVREQLEKHSIPEPNSGCWLWTGATAGARNHFYGVLTLKSKMQYAHRVSWEFHRGTIPAGLFVCHKCDTPSCINPDHLFLGSPRDNVQDSITKGRTKARRTHCNKGHLYSLSNTAQRVKNGYTYRECRKCNALRARQQRYEKVIEGV